MVTSKGKISSSSDASSEGRDERFPALAAELVRLNVEVIVSTSTPATAAAKEATATIPIVMAGVGDPVGAGLVTSLARPGGNITGVANLQLDLYPKGLELLKAALPKVTRVVSLGSTFGVEAAKLAAIRTPQEAAAQALGMTLLRIEINALSDFANATVAIVRDHPDALVLAPTPVNFALRREIAEFAIAERLPAIGANRDQSVAGILMSYGPDNDDANRAAATYVEKILKGAKPSELAIEQPTKFKFVINLKTAKMIGLAIPQSVLLRADELIQ